jgi:arsenate reductase
MSDITIYHNPACSNSRNALALIRSAGQEPNVIEYLKTPPDQATFAQLVADMGMPVRELLRQKEALYAELGLDGEQWSDAQLIDIAVRNPILMNRPIVVTPKGTRLCRPPERVLDLLPCAQPGAWGQDSGEAVIDAKGQRVSTS